MTNETIVKQALGQTYPAGLYIVATPIGNLRDITLRALDVLGVSDIILCEDTRVSGKLLSHYGVKAKLVSYHDHNGEERRPQIIAWLGEDKRISLISDAGTPLISDPGYKLVRDVQQAGFYVSVLPGASSVLAALCLSGLPTNQFHFAGFLPAKTNAAKTILQSLSALQASLVFFESARRIDETLLMMQSVFGEREVAVVREITKLFEETKRGSISELLRYYQQEGLPKGEVVIVVAPPIEQAPSLDINAALKHLLASHSVKEAATILAEQTGKPRKEIYALALALANDEK